MAGANRGEEAVVAAVVCVRVVGDVVATGALAAERVEREAVRVFTTALRAIVRVVVVTVAIVTVTVSARVAASSTALANVIEATVISCDEIWVHYVHKLFQRFQKYFLPVRGKAENSGAR